jgi:hypothetical protein
VGTGILVESEVFGRGCRSGFETPGNSASASQNTEGGRALTKEEADHLYEERMEEEYALRAVGVALLLVKEVGGGDRHLS